MSVLPGSQRVVGGLGRVVLGGLQQHRLQVQIALDPPEDLIADVAS